MHGVGVLRGEIMTMLIFNYLEAARRHPLEVYWSRPLQEFDPVRRPEAVHPDQLQAAFGGFLRGTAALMGMDG